MLLRICRSTAGDLKQMTDYNCYSDPSERVFSTAAQHMLSKNFTINFDGDGGGDKALFLPFFPSFVLM